MCGTLSNDLEKSSRTASIYWLLYVPFAKSLMVSRSLVSQERFFSEPMLVIGKNGV